MTEPADDGRWEFYQCVVGEGPASIRFDLGLEERAPIASLPVAIQVRVALKHPNAHGMTTDAEFPLLSAFEDALGRLLSDACIAGVVTGSGSRVHHLYASSFEPTAQRAQDLAGEELPDYDVEIGGFDDPDWRQYFEFLYPNQLAWRWIKDRRVLEALEEEGDDGTTPRRITHWAYFDSAESRSAFAASLPAMGYRIEEELEDQDAEHTLGLQFATTEPEPPRAIFPRTERLEMRAMELGGVYDGWEVELIAPP